MTLFLSFECATQVAAAPASTQALALASLGLTRAYVAEIAVTESLASVQAFIDGVQVLDVSGLEVSEWCAIQWTRVRWSVPSLSLSCLSCSIAVPSASRDRTSKPASQHANKQPTKAILPSHQRSIVPCLDLPGNISPRCVCLELRVS